MVKTKFHNISPKDCLELTFGQSLEYLKQIVVETNLKKAFDITESYPSPLEGYSNTDWSHNAKIIGICNKYSSFNG